MRLNAGTLSQQVLGQARRLILGLLVVGAWPLGYPGPAQAAESTPIARTAGSTILLGDCGGSYPGKVRPATWDNGCTGVADLARMTWSSWGGPTAAGSGVTQTNDCVPDCANGTVEEFPAQAYLARVRSCRANNGRVGRYYTRLRILYKLPPNHHAGSGPRDAQYRLACVSPGAPVACGRVGREGPGQALDVSARRLSCRRARRLAGRARRRVCRNGCTTRKTLRVSRYRCRFGRFNRRRFYVPVRCTRGKQVVRFKVAID